MKQSTVDRLVKAMVNLDDDPLKGLPPDAPESIRKVLAEAAPEIATQTRIAIAEVSQTLLTEEEAESILLLYEDKKVMETLDKARKVQANAYGRLRPFLEKLLLKYAIQGLLQEAEQQTQPPLPPPIPN